MLGQAVTLAHVAQGGAVATASELVQTTTQNTSATLITAITGVVSIAVANLTVGWVKQRRGTDDETTAENRKLKRELATAKRKITKLEKAAAAEPKTPARRTRKETSDDASAA